jgi:hypothetical protein
MAYIRTIAAVLISLIAFPSFAAAGDSIADLPKKAVERSQITLPGSHPFILKAKVLEATNPSNEEYKAEIEEYWVAPDKWRRTVRTSDFSQTLMVNGEKRASSLPATTIPTGSAPSSPPYSIPEPHCRVST